MAAEHLARLFIEQVLWKRNEVSKRADNGKRINKKL